MPSTAPKRIHFHRIRQTLELEFPGEAPVELDAEFLRVNSPSAEVQGHGGTPPPALPGKRGVRIQGLEPVGNYAVKIRFSDGHETGLYSWDWLRRLCIEREERWRAYLRELDQRGLGRDP